jgi:phosphodiester glycosidase
LTPLATATRHPQARASSHRLRLGDGQETTVHVVRFPRGETAVKVFALKTPAPLQDWCDREGIREAIVGGFFIRPQGTPLGELRIDGAARPSVAFEAPWDDVRSCVHATGRVTVFARRDEIAPAPAGDLLQAGPMLARLGRNAVADAGDSEGFSAGSSQFDSDITAGRYPRSALGSNEAELIAAVCDGRGEHDAGLTLEEMADAMIGLGARDAINLDGGGSASIVSAGKLLNKPREEHGIELEGGREISTALAFIRAA